MFSVILLQVSAQSPSVKPSKSISFLILSYGLSSAPKLTVADIRAKVFENFMVVLNSRVLKNKTSLIVYFTAFSIQRFNDSH